MVQDVEGNKLLLLDSPQGMVNTKSYRAVQVSYEYSWQRRSTITDMVSGMEKDNGLQDMGTIYACFEHPSESNLYGMKDTKYTFYTGQDVQEGDIVQDKIVKQVSQILGVNLVVAE